MDDLAGKLGGILQNPESMRQVQELAAMLGMDAQAGTPVPAAAPSPDLPGALTQLMPLFSDLQKEDDTTRFLRALRPLLSEERQQKIDRAMQMVRILHLLPALQESGALSSLLRLF